MTAGTGHNSVAGGKLKSLVGRIERLLVDKENIAADVKEIYKEAAGSGYDAKVLRKVVRLRKLDPADVSEEQALVETYLAALGD